MPVTLRGRQAVLLAAALVRAVPWWPVVAAAALAVAAMLPAIFGAAVPAAQVWGLRIAAVLMGASASFAMVDAMAPLTMVPTPRWLRQWLRFAVALIPSAVVWCALCLLAAGTVPAGMPPLPTGDLAAEALACYLSGLAGAAVAARIGHTMTAALAGPATQGGLMIATLFLSGTSSPWPLPQAASWADVHKGWWGAIPILLVALLVANRDGWPLLHRPTRSVTVSGPAAGP